MVNTVADTTTLDELVDKLVRGDGAEKCSAALSLQFLSLNAYKANLPRPRSLRLADSSEESSAGCSIMR